jgi:cation:H+ antiporter
MEPLTFILFVAGLGLLVGGAELLVRGAARLAAILGITPLIIGLTVVAVGTSAPEIAVALQSSASGQADLALGNIIGSNIANVLLILGFAALVAPLAVPQLLIRQDVPIMIGASLVVLVLGLDGTLGRLDGFLLLAGIVAYIVFVARQSHKESTRVKAAYAAEFGVNQPQAARGWFRHLLAVVVGLSLLIVGAGWLVDGARACDIGAGKPAWPARYCGRQRDRELHLQPIAGAGADTGRCARRRSGTSAGFVF